MSKAFVEMKTGHIQNKSEETNVGNNQTVNMGIVVLLCKGNFQVEDGRLTAIEIGLQKDSNEAFI